MNEDGGSLIPAVIKAVAIEGTVCYSFLSR